MKEEQIADLPKISFVVENDTKQFHFVTANHEGNDWVHGGPKRFACFNTTGIAICAACMLKAFKESVAKLTLVLLAFFLIGCSPEKEHPLEQVIIVHVDIEKCDNCSIAGYTMIQFPDGHREFRCGRLGQIGEVYKERAR
jgi:hypothetical protein